MRELRSGSWWARDGGLGGKSGKISSPLSPFFTGVGSFTVDEIFLWVFPAFATLFPYYSTRRQCLPIQCRPSPAPYLAVVPASFTSGPPTHTPHATPLPGPPSLLSSHLPLALCHPYPHLARKSRDPPTKSLPPSFSLPPPSNCSHRHLDQRRLANPARKPEIPPASTCLFHFPLSPAASSRRKQPPLRVLFSLDASCFVSVSCAQPRRPSPLILPSRQPCDSLPQRFCTHPDAHLLLSIRRPALTPLPPTPDPLDPPDIDTIHPSRGASVVSKAGACLRALPVVGNFS